MKPWSLSINGPSSDVEREVSVIRRWGKRDANIASEGIRRQSDEAVKRMWDGERLVRRFRRVMDKERRSERA